MKLWIRSQDGNWLMPINDIISVFQKSVFHKGIILGKYKSEERALEILNEIHQRLINLQTIEIVGVSYITSQMKRNGIDCVYQMPKE